MEVMDVTGRSRGEREHQAAAAAARYDETSEQRREVERQQEAGSASRFTGSTGGAGGPSARPAGRTGRHGGGGGPRRTAGAVRRVRADSRCLQGTAGMELPSARRRAARSIARISARENGRELPIGTGFLVSPSLLMTNHHVLPDADAARHCFVEFDAQVTVDNTPQPPTRLEFAPDGFFTADKRLDFALVLVSPVPTGGHRVRLSAGTGSAPSGASW
ncbi:trypsin-like peptidase domain-containing protein [Streptomyces sp. INA 01156]